MIPKGYELLKRGKMFEEDFSFSLIVFLFFFEE